MENQTSIEQRLADAECRAELAIAERDGWRERCWAARRAELTAKVDLSAAQARANQAESDVAQWKAAAQRAAWRVYRLRQSARKVAGYARKLQSEYDAMKQRAERAEYDLANRD